jgi:hypothetical protein
MRPIRTLFVPVFLAVAALAAPTPSGAQVALGVNISLAPPPLPVYDQPAIPALGYIWTPGYWAWGSAGYYWVPGTWVLPPAIGLLWTPGYWAWVNGAYLWHRGHWGHHVGFYGGINYGFGYGGVGYDGGYWKNNAFFYNHAVNNFGRVRVSHTYSKPVAAAAPSRVSFNGGNGGIAARPTPRENTAAHEKSRPPTTRQVQHEHVAGTDPGARAGTNHGQPPIPATQRPVVAARPAMPRPPRPAAAASPARPPEHAGGPAPAGHPPEGNRPGDNPRQDDRH